MVAAWAQSYLKFTDSALKCALTDESLASPLLTWESPEMHCARTSSSSSIKCKCSLREHALRAPTGAQSQERARELSHREIRLLQDRARAPVRVQEAGEGREYVDVQEQRGVAVAGMARPRQIHIFQ